MLHEPHGGFLHREPTLAAPLLDLCRAVPGAAARSAVEMAGRICDRYKEVPGNQLEMIGNALFVNDFLKKKNHQEEIMTTTWFNVILMRHSGLLDFFVYASIFTPGNQAN